MPTHSWKAHLMSLPAFARTVENDACDDLRSVMRPDASGVHPISGGSATPAVARCFTGRRTEVFILYVLISVYLYHTSHY
ncbi:hypothetical protein N657DRAFT_648664 [Parathielavia appendiculata]|uniref:Uncharacterized protein n=1 Tax=Parathielavia appendiculata TaxID=2587402 RepID=A0AAN6Z0Y8_9PEZI|nr:hypothetical protein N657DRAFT_648664 [Parathielavia appendiculata]